MATSLRVHHYQVLDFIIHTDYQVLNFRWDDFSPGSSLHNQLQVSSASLTKALQEIKIKHLFPDHLFESSRIKICVVFDCF